ncbi:MAG: RidA family protein [Gammaproteobacteria bacterium]|nr:RidA family protein [Gammaproteobacteria bacterium]
MRESKRTIISTADAPAAIGTYSQAVKVGQTVYISGQIPLHPETMEIVSDEFKAQAQQVVANLQAVSRAAGGSLQQAVKLMVYLTDLDDFAALNEVMSESLSEPYPARAAVQVSALPRGARIEIDAVLQLD